ncbi:TetR/AcrR family transcriptional regulator [Nocardia implantans]|uniref:TetR/AcrR family transcriptional regulator n=1 Tax=Nocardia implantans TaxID=3108168 RepID=A0ABU6AYZ8_9NOCA|nr:MULTISPECIES: TetR/AcrR family transcriptional regulator [unclassified Nocardia]MBF6190571.1 TetR/AcrR family transcriptional regulator [Nocardia beijingensis]MEA3528484.1 TetR/AcrR family transcriptional regulator [Nocardia sp. CDC192]MEB3512364.1 TetR/AcrR family transcriptional regulator [Nocardia sp. CDC186]
MARQQERARRTRAAIIRSAAVEFGKSGYAAASLNRILEGSRATKGAMYFHFDSKEDLARAVLETAVERYRASAERWLARTDLSPLDILHGVVDEIALRLEHDIIVQAEYRLIIEPDFYRDVQAGGNRILGRTTRVLTVRAIDQGQLRADADPDRFTRTLAAALAGQRYMVDLIGGQVDLRSRFEEALEVVIEAMATPEWLEKFRSDGWRAQARLDELGLSL